MLTQNIATKRKILRSNITNTYVDNIFLVLVDLCLYFYYVSSNGQCEIVK